MPSKNEDMSVITAAFEPLEGKLILDIGCGEGALARSLSDLRANVTGVDPNGEAVADARRAVPAGMFHQAGAEALPFAAHCFDGAIFSNSLHHVPELAMREALQEAARVVKPSQPIFIIEPLAEGSFFSVLRTVEDETSVRTAAQRVIDEVLEKGIFEQIKSIDYTRRERFTDLDQFLVRVVAVDPARATVIEERRPRLEAAFLRYAKVSTDNSTILEQPIRAHVLKARA